MKKLMIFGLAAVFAMTGMVSAQNLLSNGDFELGENDPADGTQPNELNPVGWTEDHSGGWSNREINEQMPDGYSYAMGNAGGYGAVAYQDISVADDGAVYKLSADSLLDAWWMNSGYLRIEFYDAGGTTLLGGGESPHWTQPDYDTGTPLTNYELFAPAPAGTGMVRAILGTWGEGGTARFDNAVMVVPEPATLGLLGLSGLALWIVRRRG